jgi:hypothetical protein
MYIVVISAHLIAMLIPWLLYNKILAIVFDLPFISYWQLWIIRIVLSWLAVPIDFSESVKHWTDESDKIVAEMSRFEE